MEHPRRLRLLHLSVTMLPLLLREGAGWRLVHNPLPPDAKFVRWYLEGPHQDLTVVVESGEFPMVGPGDPVPLMPGPTFGPPDSRMGD